MKIFVFRPSLHWSYCGGGRVVIANTKEEAYKMFPGDFFFEEELEETDRYCNIWVLVGEFEVTESIPRIILNEYKEE